MSKAVVIEEANYRVVFDPQAAGFPGSLALSVDEGWEEVAAGSLPWMEAELGDGTIVRPFWPESYQPSVRRVGEAVQVEFRSLPWADSQGRVQDGFKITLRYDLWPDGLCFVDTFFMVEKTNPPALAGFRLTPRIALSEGNDVSWAYWQFPQAVGGDIIQAIGSIERNLAAGEERCLDGMISPDVSFDFGTEGRRNKHLELMVEGYNSLTPEFNNTSTTVTWNEGNPSLTWEFMKEGRSSKDRPWQWRNKWGWILCQAPRKRRHAPLRMYHYFDNFKRYPTSEQIRKMSDEGADMLVMHENWRDDPQNGGRPYDEAEFAGVVSTAHSYGMRVAPYIRGNELSVREDACDWFDEFLQQDHDGLYMDYGGPIHYVSSDENFPGGRIAFKEHFLAMRKLRERVGDKGVLLSHTGPFYSATGLAGLADGYTAGEGEKGVLLSNRTNHAYFSGSSVCPGAMWTAAFPDYHTKRAVPFMAVTGQTPHVTLGTQAVSSSLAHPKEPGNITYARPLWKLWGLFSGQHDVTLLHEHNTTTLFETDSPMIGVSLMQAGDGSMLLIAANFSSDQRETEVCLNWESEGITAPPEDWTVFRLDPEQTVPLAEKYTDDTNNFQARLCGYGLAGWLIMPDATMWQSKIDEFRRSYPVMDQAAKDYLAEVEALRARRFDPQPSLKAYIRVKLHNFPFAYEDSLWWDLYDCWNELYRVKEDAGKELLGYVSSLGLVRSKPVKEEFIWPGVVTPWIALHEVLSEGTHDLEIRSKHLGEDFYSFIIAEITDDPGNPERYRELTFANELDEDRARLSFRVKLGR
ncbi:MAG: hypothetical protein PHT33_14675, partial [bacterium]|nr:hypothetical protein [bacterium]